MWSDSGTLISWIHSFHRVGEILDTTDKNDWRWVPTNSSAADKATKWNKRMKYTTGKVWTNGP